ncbi:MAG: hypothetical protein HY684_04085, partial [Chloroflexi bacterium]|nr:hypothetical protein [Chloroflexota bacterium]
MSFQEAMHSLVEGIIDSQKARAAGITALRSKVADQREVAQALLSNLQDAHQAMAKRQRASLAKARDGLAQDENKRKTDVGAWMQDVASAHQAMAKRQQASLAKARA